MNRDLKLFGPDRLYERWRWQIFGITWLAYAGFYLTRKSFSVAKIELAKPEVMAMTKEDMARIDGASLVAYAIGQFVWGMAGDKWGARRVVLGGLLGSVLSAVAMGASTTVVALGVLFFVQGLCQSTGWAPLAKNLGNLKFIGKGWPTFTPDGRFIIGESRQRPGFVMAGGCNAHGISGSGGIGRLLVESLLDPNPSAYVRSLSPDRFTESSWNWEEARRQAAGVYETYYGV